MVLTCGRSACDVQWRRSWRKDSRRRRRRWRRRRDSSSHSVKGQNETGWAVKSLYGKSLGPYTLGLCVHLYMCEGVCVLQPSLSPPAGEHEVLI